MRWLKRQSKKLPQGRQGAKAAPRRRRAAPRWVRPTVRTTLIAAVGAAAVGGPVWLWQSGWAGTILDRGLTVAVTASAAMGLTVQDVLLQGRTNTPRDDVMEAVSLRRGDAILGFDPDRTRERLVALPWVRDAWIERRLPGSVHIHIQERRPLALWQRDGKLALVDDEGEVIADRNLGRFRNLLIIVGPDAPRHAATLVALLASEPALAKQVASAVRVGNRRWNVRFSDGVQVKLPEADAHEAWRRLARLESRHKLLARDVRVIDMRLPDRLIVRTGEPGSEAQADKGKRT